jgi:hypothetical protein
MKKKDLGMPRKGEVAGIAWQTWITSDEGRGCMAEPGSIHQAAYLQNRLWRAFMAGWNAKPCCLTGLQRVSRRTPLLKGVQE